MKKLVLFLCSALIIGFNSCNSDEPLVDDGGNPIPTQRKITKIEIVGYDGILKSTATFNYNNKGQWIAYQLVRNNEDNDLREKFSISYIQNTIIVKNDIPDRFSEDNISRTMTLNNKGQIITNTDIYDSYTYNNDYLIGMTLDGRDYVSFEYSNGNLIKCKEGNYTYNITYTDIEDKIGLNIIPFDYNDGDCKMSPNNPLYQFGFFGKKSKNLIKSVSNGLKYTYKLDQEGYVTEIDIPNIIYKIYY